MKTNRRIFKFRFDEPGIQKNIGELLEIEEEENNKRNEAQIKPEFDKKQRKAERVKNELKGGGSQFWEPRGREERRKCFLGKINESHTKKNLKYFSVLYNIKNKERELNSFTQE